MKLLHVTITYTFHIEVTVNGYFLLIGPQHSRKHFDTKSSARQDNAIKRSLLNRAERRMLETEWKFLSQSMSFGEMFVRGIAKHFVRNTKVTITDVHIRYQDVTTIPHHSFVFGVTIKHIRIRNREEKKVHFGDDVDGDNNGGNGINEGNESNDPYLNRKSNNFLDNYLLSKLDDSSSDEDVQMDNQQNRENQQSQSMEEVITKQMEDALNDEGDVHKGSTPGKEEKSNGDGDSDSDPELDRKVITKQIEIEALSVYNDIAHDEQKGTDIIWHEESMSDSALRTKFEFIPSKQLRISSYNYILKPFALKFNVFLHENFRGYIEKYPDEPHKWRPNVQCDVSLGMIDIYVSTKQMFALHSWSQNMDFIRMKVKYYKLIQEMKRQRPSIPVTGPNGRKLWWQYLIQCRETNIGEKTSLIYNILSILKFAKIDINICINARWHRTNIGIGSRHWMIWKNWN